MRILTPNHLLLVGEARLYGESTHVNMEYSLPRGREAHGTYINIPMTLHKTSPGGLKGCMVPGDAHPYLVPYIDIRTPHFERCFGIINDSCRVTRLTMADDGSSDGRAVDTEGF